MSRWQIYEVTTDADGVDCYIKRGYIVRCKECKFSEVIQNDSSGVMARYCRAFTLPMMKSDDDYCSYGEREGE